jgi:hypothetical protein
VRQSTRKRGNVSAVARRPTAPHVPMVALARDGAEPCLSVHRCTPGRRASLLSVRGARTVGGAPVANTDLWQQLEVVRVMMWVFSQPARGPHITEEDGAAQPQATGNTDALLRGERQDQTCGDQPGTSQKRAVGQMQKRAVGRNPWRSAYGELTSQMGRYVCSQ